MASPDMKCGWIGEVTMVDNGFKAPPATVSISPAIDEEQEVDPQRARINRLNSSDRRQLNEQISNLSRNEPAFGRRSP
jgi:hypothetical protein